MEAGDQFAFGLGQVEGQAARLGDAGDEEDPKADKLRHDEPEAALGLDDIA